MAPTRRAADRWPRNRPRLADEMGRRRHHLQPAASNNSRARHVEGLGDQHDARDPGLAQDFRRVSGIAGRILALFLAPAHRDTEFVFQDVGHHRRLGIFRPQRPAAADQHGQLRLPRQPGAMAGGSATVSRRFAAEFGHRPDQAAAEDDDGLRPGRIRLPGAGPSSSVPISAEPTSGSDCNRSSRPPTKARPNAQRRRR